MVEKTQQKLFRFYRSNLASIVWDKEAEKPLVEFVNGQFYTEDETIAEKLIALGYLEVPLDLETPPEVFFKRGRALKEGENAPLMPKNMNEEVALQKEKAILKQQELKRKAEEAKTKAKSFSEEEVDQSPADIMLAKKGEGKNKAKKEVEKTKTKTIAAADKIAKTIVSGGKKEVRKIKRRKR